jgi:YrhK-like protein
LCFVGSWFFTSAGWMQLVLADPEKRSEWLSAATQFAGTVLFNVSTGSAVWAQAVTAERRFVWAPDATGSVAFLVSGVLALAAVGVLAVRSRDGLAAWVNMIGCIAFGVSAVAAFVTRTGDTVDTRLANLGTFLGALCFLAAALMLLPRSRGGPQVMGR